MGNIDAKRDWGHAKDYVRMQWMMLQQDKPEDYVIATGVQFSIREFIQWSATELGFTMLFRGTGVDEIGYVGSIQDSNKCGSLNVDDVIVKIDPRYFRPTEVESLLGDPTKAKNQLGLVPDISAQEMCWEMVLNDLIDAKKQALLKKHGYNVNITKE